MKNIGLIVNPLAGVGGPAGMKGSDREESLARARELNVQPVAPRRAKEVLTLLKENAKESFRLFAAPGIMGADYAKEAGFDTVVVGTLSQQDGTSAEDTKRIAKLMANNNLALLLFAGGDGTARDICEAIGTSVCTLGIPSGVKMHSAVFALHTAAAAQLILNVLALESVPHQMQEVMDLDELAYTQGRVSAKLYGYLCVPNVRQYLQGLKSGGAGGEEDLPGIVGSVLKLMKGDLDSFFVIGAGTTTMAIKMALGFNGTLLGVDVVREGKLVARDVNGKMLEDLVMNHPTKIVISPIGGQGFIFGRGSQQISPAVISEVGKNNVIVVCTARKLASLDGQPFLVDTGAMETDELLYGYIRVITGRGVASIYKIAPTRT